MAKQPPIYARRRWLRTLEKGWSRLEGLVNRFSTASEVLRPYNPLYHLGTLAIFLLIVITVTGIYLTVFYRPGTDRAYLTVAAMTDTWLGSLMRSIHRYASNGLILVTFLHALKTWLSDRYWGSRWLAWVSGWVMLALFWIIGLMGYWLVWDQAAQWLTEYAINIFRGSLAYSFLGADVAASTFALFVIVLFLHAFVPILLLLGIIIHVLRLTRAQYWSPRWVMGITLAALVGVAAARPFANLPPADLGKLVTEARLDWLYLGFLPLAERVGNPLFWGVSVAALIAAIALPWWQRGQHDGPAIVLPDNCTGCAVCARECPYDAIEMRHRDDESAYSSIALVTPDLCTGCGICVGSCPDKAIELARLHSAVMRQDLQRTLSRAQADGRPAIVVFACDRHQALGTLPPLTDAQPIAASGLAVSGSIPIMQAKLPPRVNVGSWPDSAGNARPVVTCVVPCTGTIHPNWASEMMDAGAAGAIVVACPGDDCAHREGPHWIADRLKRRRTLRKGNTHFLELAPGSPQPLLSLWAGMIGDKEKAAQRATVVGKRPKQIQPPTMWGQARHLAAGLLVLLVVFLAALALEQPGAAVLPEQGQIRLAMNHGGKLMAANANLDPSVLEKLPDNIDPSQVLGGERYPVHLRVEVDGRTAIEEVYRPRGLRREGAIYGMNRVWLPPGGYAVKVWLMDDETDWRLVFEGDVDVAEGQVRDLLFDEGDEVFRLR